MEFNITEQDIHNYITSLGYRPACPPICIDKMRRDFGRGVIEFDFFINIHNLCWYADEAWKSYNSNDKLLIGNSFTVNLRDFRLGEILSN